MEAAHHVGVVDRRSLVLRRLCQLSLRGCRKGGRACVRQGRVWKWAGAALRCKEGVVAFEQGEFALEPEFCCWHSLEALAALPAAGSGSPRLRRTRLLL